jgi:hypothetical protein
MWGKKNVRCLIAISAFGLVITPSVSQAFDWDPDKFTSYKDGLTIDTNTFSLVSSSCSVATIDSVATCDFCEVWDVDIDPTSWFSDVDEFDFFVQYTLTSESVVSENAWYWSGSWNTNCDYEDIYSRNTYKVNEDGGLVNYDYNTGEQIVGISFRVDKTVWPYTVGFYCFELRRAS